MSWPPLGNPAQTNCEVIHITIMPVFPVPISPEQKARDRNEGGRVGVDGASCGIFLVLW